jgi:hypothetical protein
MTPTSTSGMDWTVEGWLAPLSRWSTALIQRLAERGERLVADHPLLSDVCLAIAVAAAGVAGLWSQDRLSWQQLAFTAALSLPLLLRRSQPMLVFAALALIAATQWVTADPQLADAALLLALYGVALRGSASPCAEVSSNSPWRQSSWRPAR